MDTKTKKCLFRWQDYSSTVTVAVQTLRFDEELLDVTLACEGSTIRAHKLVLAASSLYFRQILREHPCDHPTIVIDGIEWKDLLSILHFMYNGQVLVEEHAVMSLLTAAASLAVIGLSYVTAALVYSKVNEQQCISLSEKKEEERMQCLPISKTTDKEETLFSNFSGSQDNLNAQNCSNYVGIDVPSETNEPKKSRTASKKIIEVERKKSRIAKEPPEKKQKLSSKLKNTICPNAKRNNTGDNMTIDSDNFFSTSLQRENLSSFETNHFEQNEVKTEIEKIEETLDEASNNKMSKSKISFSNFNKISLNLVENGIGCSMNRLTDNDLLDNQDSQDASSPENGDMDLGPAALPLNHPAVLAAASSSAAAIAEATNDSAIPSSVESANHINTISYAAFLAATGMLPSGVGSGVSANLPWLSSLNELTHSPSSPIYGLNTSQLSGMSQQELQATLEQYQRKLAFHEPRPCPTCSRMYRDAATLRTHIAIMHSEGKEPFACTCGSIFRTKYDMYQHRKNNHR